MTTKDAPPGPTGSDVVLMFSGGRDSTIAALRLQELGYRQTLVTVTSDHLHGINLVRKRLKELRGILPSPTRWVQLRQPKTRATRQFNQHTCLPCHHAYVSLAGRVVRQIGATAIAFGYAEYQSDWPEQTPMAVASLRRVLARFGLALLLPAHSIRSKSEALQLLTERGLSTDALEQKCTKQVTNIALPHDQLRREIELWESAITASLAEPGAFPLEVITEGTLGDF